MAAGAAPQPALPQPPFPPGAGTHPLAAEVIQPLADEAGGLGQQHLHAQGAAQAVEPVEQRSPGTQEQQEPPPPQHLLPQRLHAVVGEADGEEEGGQQDGGAGAVQAAEPAAAQRRQGALEGVQEGAAEHGPEQGPQEGLQDEVNQDGGAAAQPREEQRSRVVEGLLDRLLQPRQRHPRRPARAAQRQPRHGRRRRRALRPGGAARPPLLRRRARRDLGGSRRGLSAVSHRARSLPPSAGATGRR